jgi:hypothetical protein
MIIYVNHYIYIYTYRIPMQTITLPKYDMETKHGHIYEEHHLSNSMFWNVDSMLNLRSVYMVRGQTRVYLNIWMV